MAITLKIAAQEPLEGSGESRCTKLKRRRSQAVTLNRRRGPGARAVPAAGKEYLCARARQATLSSAVATGVAGFFWIVKNMIIYARLAEKNVIHYAPGPGAQRVGPARPAPGHVRTQPARLGPRKRGYGGQGGPRASARSSHCSASREITLPN